MEGENKMPSSVDESVGLLISNLLNEFSFHPLIGPYLHASKDDPPKYYLHQYEILARLALRQPIRVFVADEIGLGKTVTAILIAKHLEIVGRAHRVLIIVPRVLMLQWRKELVRMGVPSSRMYQMERDSISALKEEHSSEGYYLASMDLLKKEKNIEKIIKIPWDLIIVDEAHRFGYNTKRFFNIGKRLIEAYPIRNVLFLSATPHRGDPKDYLERLRLLDPYLSEWKDLDTIKFYEATHGAVIFRRTKEDVNNIYEGKQIFPPIHFYASVIKASKLENKFVEDLISFLRDKLTELASERKLLNEKVIPLLTVLVFKRASSSPYAAYTTLERLLAKRAGFDEAKLNELIDSIESFLSTGYEEFDYEERDPEESFNEFLEDSSSLLNELDIGKIKQLRNKAKEIMEESDTKLSALINLLEWVSKNNFKAVVFTEYRDTLEYIYEQLTKRFSKWKEGILTLSGEDTRDEEKFKKIRNKFEKDPNTWLLIATDVVSEGINLQVANILINYEIPWSFVKLEQRIGRVWRLGQTKEVHVYTIFMDNVSDEAALNSMYVKLLNLRRANFNFLPFIGEEVLYFSESKEVLSVQSQVMLEKAKEKKEFKRVTEYTAISTFIKEGKAGLERLIQKILEAKKEFEKELNDKRVLYLPKTKEEAEMAPKLLGFRTPAELINSMKSLLESSYKYLGLTVNKDGDTIKVSKGYEMPTPINTLDDFFGFLHTGKMLPTTIVSYGDTEDTLLLVRVIVKYENLVIYREPAGVYVEQRKVIRGSDLINTVSASLFGCIGVLEENSINLSPDIEASVSWQVRKKFNELLSQFNNYRSLLNQVGLRSIDNWGDSFNFEIKVEPFSSIRFVKKPPEKIVEFSEEIKREIEEKAVQFVLEIEEKEGRIATKVSDNEHYDIRSVNPKTGEIRKIEVKGHAYGVVYAELTNSEAELARKEGENYWIYIIYDIKGEKPKYLRFNNPLKTMNWLLKEKVEKRYILWPKSGSD